MSGQVYDENEIVNFLKNDMKVTHWWKDLVKDWESQDIDLVKARESIPWSESLTAETMHLKFANRLSYISATDTWYAWNGTIHVPCEGTATLNKLIKIYAKFAIGHALDFIEEYCEKQAKAIIQAAPQGDQTAQDNAKKMRDSYTVGFKKQRSFRDRMASIAGISAVAQCLKIDCAISSRYFDNDQKWFVMKNWVLDLDDFRNGGWTLLPHSPSRNVTKFFDADYDLEKNLGHWDNFLDSSLPNKNVQKYVQEVIGAGFMGTAELKAILNFLGAKDSGKSMFINTIVERCLGGAGYASMPDSMAIIKVPGQNFNQDKFKGKRFVAISEPDENLPADTAFLKRFSGDSTMETGGKHENSRDWTPQGVLCIAANNALKINIRDGASIDRIKIIDFPHRFYPAGPGVDPQFEQVPNLKALLREDSSRVLGWIIQGMLRYRKDKFSLDEPVEVKLSQDKMTDGLSSAIRWINELIDEDQIVVDFTAPVSHGLKVRDSYKVYKFWAMEVHEFVLSERLFSLDIQAKFGEVKKSGGTRFQGLIPTQIFVDKWDQTLNMMKK